MCDLIPTMTRICAVFVILSLLCRGSYAELCADLDTSACTLLAARPDFCVNSTLAHSACKRTCGNCPLTCYYCPQTPVTDPKQCINTTTCPADKTCVINTLHTSDGHEKHLMSCESKQLCDGIGMGFLVGKRQIQSRDISLHCCNSDLCNVPGYVPSTNVPPTPPITVPGIYNCKNDIIFIVDESASIGVAAFRKAIDFISDLVRQIDIGIHETQVGLLVYDNKPHAEWNLNEYTTKASLLGALTYVPYHAGVSRADLAIQYVQNTMFQFSAGDRIAAQNIVVIITDGHSTVHSSTLTAAQDLHNQGVVVVAIGVGHTFDDELRQVASDSNHALKVSGYDHFSSAIPIVLPLICV